MARVVAERAKTVPQLAEVFREYGFEGASLSLISERTGLGKGSLYNFFPGGKEEMAQAVLTEIDEWFEANVFAPLRSLDPGSGIARMLAETEKYFGSGRRACVVGMFALSDTRDRFAEPVKDYFVRWTEALTAALRRAGRLPHVAQELAEYAVATLQGALVLSRAMDDTGVFSRACRRVQRTLTMTMN
jgi:TetR/AcrR family transcriptional regulator, lmrAB and yxaGH operons repressor